MESHDRLREGIEIRGDRQSGGKAPVLGTSVPCLTSVSIKDPSMWARLKKLLLGSEKVSGMRGEKVLQVTCYNYGHATDLPYKPWILGSTGLHTGF